MKFFFDSNDGLCKRFVFTGCGGNDNSFDAFDECEMQCGDSVDICDLRAVTGRCYDSVKRWYFDGSVPGCVEFTFTGCDGNENNFESDELCLAACKHKVLLRTETFTMLEAADEQRDDSHLQFVEEVGDYVEINSEESLIIERLESDDEGST
jgi:hypothetical protein